MRLYSWQTLPIVGLCVGSFLTLSPSVWADPTFLNRLAYPLPVVLNEIGPFHQNYLKTYEVLTQWSNQSDQKVNVKIAFTFFDSDSSGSRTGEDGKDDILMTQVETISIPPQVSLWVKTHRLTVIGEKLNEGFDHLEEGVGLELSLNAQIISIQYLPSY